MEGKACIEHNDAQTIKNEFEGYRILDLVRMTEGLLDFSKICKREVIMANKLTRSLMSGQMILSIMGQFKRGKSSLINTMLGKELLPVGIIPITSVVTRITKAKKEDIAYVHYEDTTSKTVPITELSGFISEQENPDNLLGVESVEIKTSGKLLDKGIVVVDTPGVGSIHKHNSKSAYDFIKESDGVIFALSVDSPINEIEITFLKSVREFAGRFYFVVNKIDVITKQDLESYINYCRKLLAGILETTEDRINIFPVSAKTAEGVEVLEDFILEDCTKKRDEIIEISTKKRLNDIIEHGLTSSKLYWKTTGMANDPFNQRYEILENILKFERSDSEKFIKEEHTKAELAGKVNKIRKAMVDGIEQCFTIKYNYETGNENVVDGDQKATELEIDAYKKSVNAIFKDLEQTLKILIAYRQDDAVVVAKRLRNIHIIRDKLRLIQEIITR